MALKILLVTGDYLPGKNGGIENYTHRLAILLLQNELGVEVAALDLGNFDDYVYEGVKVNNLGGSFQSFEDLLQKENFDICHFHEYSAYGGIEIPWFKKAKEYCKKIFFTFHLPYLTCYKNDFRYKGIEDCNHFTDPQRCTECIIADKFNYKKWGRSEFILKLLEASLSITGKRQKFKGRVINNYEVLSELLAICDQVFLIAGWFDKLLRLNGYNSTNIILLHNGIKTESASIRLVEYSVPKNKMIFAGRIQHQKGLHLLCEAMRELKTAGVEIEVYGNVVDEDYFKNCQDTYPFNYKGILPREELLKLLPHYDFLVLPSVFTEMYPMVIQEAFHAGLPVIASAAKGNVDLIEEGKNGFLFDYDNDSDLTRVIDTAYKLKNSGWLPLFKTNEFADKNIQELLSYYVI